jgi:urease subunit alpha
MCAFILSGAAYEKGIKQQLGLERIVLPVRHCRNVGKKDMVHNGMTPQIDVNPHTYQVSIDGELVTCEPAQKLPLA